MNCFYFFKFEKCYINVIMKISHIFNGWKFNTNAWQ